MHVQGETAYELAVNEDVRLLLGPVPQPTGAQDEVDQVKASVVSHRHTLNPKP